MQAVILAAGSSTRTYPLTVNRPKPLLKAANKTILEHNIEQLNGLADEIIIVVGFMGNMIQDFIKDKYDKKTKGRIKFAWQEKQLGTGDALIQAKDFLKGRFIVIGGDDFFCKEDLKQLLRHRYAVLADKTDTPGSFGICKLKGSLITEIVEKPARPPSNLANTGAYALDMEIFKTGLKKTKRNEIELVDYINSIAKSNEVYCATVKNYWLPVPYPWKLLDANEYFLKNLKAEVKGEIEKGATINGNVLVGKGTKIKSGTSIEGNVIIGENCEIGPNTYIRGSTAIGNSCKLGQAVEIKNSVIADRTRIPHLSYVGDSVIGENCNLGAGTVVANLRHDNRTIKSMVNGSLIDTERRKLGTIIGDNVKTGINTTIYPGRKIWPGKQTTPGQVVKEDLV